MRLMTERGSAIDLTTTPVHLGLGSRAMPIDGFAWEPEVLEAYSDAVADDGPEGRMVMMFESGPGPWSNWEVHPAGDEVVICLSGRMTLIQEIDGEDDPVELGPGEAVINPAGVWHTADVHERARYMTITPGAGTAHRDR
jgi:quercetin dioxygenase-like cupin family protein